MQKCTAKCSSVDFWYLFFFGVVPPSAELSWHTSPERVVHEFWLQDIGTN